MKTTFLFASAMAIILINGLVFAQDTTLTITDAGNVGIGTTSPISNLEIRGTTNDNSIAGLNVTNLSGNSLLYVRNGGDIGIGTTLPMGRLHVVRNDNATYIARFENTAGGSSIYGISVDIPNSIDGCALRVQTSGARAFTVQNDGTVGIGVSYPTATLEVKAGGTTLADAWSTRSSKRFKTNIIAIGGSIEKVKRLRGVEFDWKTNGKHDIGLIAEEVGEVIPEVVSYEENGKDAKSIDYSRIVAVLIEAIKEQQKQIDELKTAANAITSLR